MLYAYDGPRTSISLTRRFAAPAAEVYAAWVTPALAERWLFTTKTSRTVCELDVRVGGAYTITRRRADKVYVAVGEYLVVEPPHRLAFTFGMPQFAADFDTVTVEIVPEGAGCVMTMTHSEMRPGYERSTVRGWEKMFDLLAQVVA